MSAGVTRNEVIAAIGVMLAACVATATAVHRLDQGKADAEVKRVQGEAEARLMSAEARSYAEIKRIEGERALAESMWRNEIEHYKREVQSYTHDYEPYKEAKEKNREKMKKKKKKKKREKDEKEEEEEEESGVKTK